MTTHHGLLEEKRLLEQRLIYGYYPDIVTHPSEEEDRLRQLTDSYLYKDLLTWGTIKKPDLLITLLQALAFQVGQQVSYNELSQHVGLDKETVEKYIMLLEQAYIIFRIGSFSRNLRNELKKSRKIYFYDNGIRNSVIANFNPSTLRRDMGALWENFLISERMKYNHYHGKWVNRYFWRTHAQQEIDYLEEGGGQLNAFEFKWNPARKVRFSRAFTQAYPDARTAIIHRENFEDFVMAHRL